MRQFRSGKATLGIQLTGFAIAKNCFRRGLWLHTANLRLPLIRTWRAEIPGKIIPNSLKGLADIRENPFLH
jgi:hypothetical protein